MKYSVESIIFERNHQTTDMIWNERNLVAGINQKNEEAFHQLFLRFHSYLVVFAVRRMGDTEAAEDIVQDTFVSVWENDRLYNSFIGLKAWLYELVHNKCLNYLKHKNVEYKYYSHLSFHSTDESDAFDLTQEEVYRRLYLAVRELPEKCRAVFELHLEGRKNDEIAVLLGISVLTVKAHKQNAVRYLKERMGNLFLMYLLIQENHLS